MPAPASRTGAAGTPGPVSEVGDQPPQRCLGTRIRPPAAAARLASQPRPHPAPRRGAAHLRVLPAPPQPPERSKSLVFVLSLRRPQGAGHVTPRGGILTVSMGLKK